MGTPEFWRRVLASDRVSLHYCNPAVTIRDTSSELGPGSTPKRCMRSLGLRQRMQGSEESWVREYCVHIGICGISIKT